jgi:hypothetical protein
MNILDLAKPFPESAIHWRAQNVTGDGTKALALAYLDARDVMDRLDEVCGPAGWQTYYDETPTGRVICKLSILIDGEWICKSDGAGSTAVEGEKGGISDALKRAAVAWGIGRYLYALKSVWAPCQSRDASGKKRWIKWEPAAQNVFSKALRSLGKPANDAPPAKITETQRKELVALFDASGVPVGNFLKVAKIDTLDALHSDWFERAKGWITEQSQQQKEA